MGMDIKQIQDLIKFVSKSGVNEVAIEEKDFKITIKTNQEPTYVTASAPVAAAPLAAAPQPVAATPVASAAAPIVVSEEANFITIKSPMIGTFYRSAGPGKPMFANVGDEINSGKVLCIIEAMKLFNEIESEVSGKIVKILVEDAQPVEFDQPLFLVDPR
ncbi:acetyl-CoA carboxylase biotin carboxyl carrier protein [Sphingobacterium sp. SRCM116780]|uniref:acetyl-CoA carboxylase biotin carboxyl carrier protein n=1 Tax=Sphingobacterium sp. SRCM116780 TaxID=2907623 RepID=UPI001F3BCB1F|nr:acetyl-CoA carboxylase biotin carboxyl carrier protein [Sphingobacterium sp. SRCM116780]UIR55134.1 acetyl-CoA carboxylase biotin carboxyl carrier protein [Sphingobacterium sp. SRCM116780]